MIVANFVPCIVENLVVGDVIFYCEETTDKRSFETLLDVMEFALEDTLIKDFDGQLWKQLKGIPMGDPHSPGMTIGACSWMEHEWMQTLDPATKDFFIA